MIIVEDVRTSGVDAAVRGMRNPKNSWSKSDSEWEFNDENEFVFQLGKADEKLGLALATAGTDHGKFLRFITVTCDITAPLYWWKEFDTYRAGVEKNSCSTMHKIQAKEFTEDDFSHEHLDRDSMMVLDSVIHMLNQYRTYYNRNPNKDDWWQMIQLLPSSYNQKRTCMISYAALRNMYHARKNHKLDEWKEFCHWIEDLPNSEFITEK